MPKILPSIMLTAAIGIAAGIGSASAAPISPAPVAPITADNPNIVKVAKWDRDRHGRRCMHRNDRCRHYHRGHYYEKQWWTLPLIIGGSIMADRAYGDDYDYDYADAGDSHVQWCLDRYRSYNLRTNTWVSYSGHVRQCISPFS